jgi:hypothetical protein
VECPLLYKIFILFISAGEQKKKMNTSETLPENTEIKMGDPDQFPTSLEMHEMYKREWIDEGYDVSKPCKHCPLKKVRYEFSLVKLYITLICFLLLFQWDIMKNSMESFVDMYNKGILLVFFALHYQLDISHSCFFIL